MHQGGKALYGDHSFGLMDEAMRLVAVKHLNLSETDPVGEVLSPIVLARQIPVEEGNDILEHYLDVHGHK